MQVPSRHHANEHFAGANFAYRNQRLNAMLEEL